MIDEGRGSSDSRQYKEEGVAKQPNKRLLGLEDIDELGNEDEE